MISSQTTITKSHKKTTTIDNGIKVLGYSDVRKAAECLLESFQDDALARMLVCHLPTEQQRRRCEILLYEAYLRQHIAKGLVLGQGESSDGFETVSIWSVPDSEERGLNSFPTLMEAGYGKLWNAIGEDGREKVFHGMLPLLHDSCERIINTDSRFKNKEIYTLVYVGSRQSARGKGNLRKLFEYMFNNYIDQDDNSIAYLESSSPTNIPIYERFGFRVVENIMLGDNSIDNAVEGRDYAIMNVMIRGVRGNDWTKDENTYSSRGKL
ncbi:uncharacterized protein J8A68_002572 [[Candida] subhashii]|uniref:N-acetyltransferase domain-containing protein n=1 Tax=[Candida] subhashii TaxID=561895 RepID=A0A8J5QCV2_9ASCO|nr:uncharacterized protein J8A68_002572 [[Candida] subhashii]KAG7663884.1 hypothetical protein J8A68_002572 [[Candida] subhashii]